MLNLSYYMPVKLFYGADCIKQNACYFQSLGRKCLIVTGKNSAKVSGALDDVLQVLEKHQIDFIIFDEIKQNPLLSDCVRAGKIAQSEQVDFVIGIGGGSPLDAAKAVSVFASNEMEPLKIFEGNYVNRPLPLILVGTTAGTGSEVTPYSVLNVDIGEDKVARKRSVQNLYAAASFGDYQYTRSLNQSITIATALDTLSHCIESYFSKKSNTISEGFAKQGAKLVVDVFRDLNGEFTDKQRQKLYAASIYGGLAIAKTGTCYCHSMGYFLTEDYQVAHGIACAVFLPSFLRLGCELDTKKADELLFELDDNLSNLCDMIENLTQYRPIYLTQTQKNELCERWKKDNKFASSPGDFTVADAMELIDEIFGV